MSDVRRFVYIHDNSQFDQVPMTMEIERLGFKDGFYRFEVRTTDATDYERAQMNIVGAYFGNPTFKEVTP